MQTVEQRQGIKISAPEEIAYKVRLDHQGKAAGKCRPLRKIPYGQHLKNVADDKLQY